MARASTPRAAVRSSLPTRRSGRQREMLLIGRPPLRGGPFIAPDEKKRPADEEHFTLAQGNWWGGSTHKGDAIYLHILRWPAETVALPAIPRRIVRHSVLTGGSAAVKQSE